MKTPAEFLIETLTSKVEAILKTGNSAQRLYLRVRPDGAVDATEETSYCVSPDEYYKRVPHTLSLEVLKSSRDYSSLTTAEIEECADGAADAAQQIVEGWIDDIEAWIEAGNLFAAAK